MKTSTLKRTINIPALGSLSTPLKFPDFFWDPHPDSKNLLVQSLATGGFEADVYQMPTGLTASQLFAQALKTVEGTEVDFGEVTPFNFCQMLHLISSGCLTSSAQLSLLLMNGVSGPQIAWFQKNGPKWVVYSYDPDSGFEFPLPAELYVIKQ